MLTEKRPPAYQCDSSRVAVRCTSQSNTAPLAAVLNQLNLVLKTIVNVLERRWSSFMLLGHEKNFSKSFRISSLGLFIPHPIPVHHPVVSPVPHHTITGMFQCY